MENEEVATEWKPEHPRLQQIAAMLRDMSLYKDTPLKELIEPTAQTLENASYGDRMTEGRGETLRIKPEVLQSASDLSNLIPGKAMASIGPIGLRRLGDAGLWKKYIEIKNALGKTKPEEWQLQKQIVEDNPGWFAVPRGRDADPTLPHVKFGYEIPEAKVAGPVGDTLSSVYSSPRHYQAYPDLENYTVSRIPGTNTGRFNAMYKDVGVGAHLSEQDLLNTLNHEVNHFVQLKEGWPGGTSPAAAGQNLSKIDLLARTSGADSLPRELQKQLDVAALMKASPNPKSWVHVEYRRAAGEQLAEAAAKSAAKGGGFIQRSYTSTPALMYDPHVQSNAILDLTKRLNEEQYKKDLADEISRYMQK